MPNWVFNSLTIEGSKTSALKLKKQMNKPFVDKVESHGDLSFNVKEVKYSKPVFAFHNIHNHTQDGISDEDYIQQPWSNDESRTANPNSWYNWNIRNWGVKWDVAVNDEEKYPETELTDEGENGENYVLVYSFNTPWGVAENALIKLSAQYPDLLFTLSFEEEGGWGGEWEILKGELISSSEYNWKCRNCEYEEIDEPPYCEDCDYDMCPECGYGEPYEICQTHMLQSESTEKAEV